MSYLREKWSIVLIIIVGLIVALFSWHMVQEQINNAEKTATIIVPNKDIEAYSVITSENLSTVQLPLRAVDKYMARDKSQIVNKVTTIPLLTKKPVDTRMLTDRKSNLGNKQVVGVYVDAARCAGVQEGDLVDVYWLQGTEIAQPSSPIARNVRVLRVSDERGIPVKSSSVVAQNIGADTALARAPKIVYLVLSPEEVPYVINGSAENSKIALSKKSKEDDIGEVSANVGISQQTAQ